MSHRVVMGSMHLGLERLDDEGAALAAFYAARARGGAELIVTGGSAVSRVGAAGHGYSLVGSDADAPRLAGVASAVHAEGGRVLLQLFHAGRYAHQDAYGLQPVAPSAVYAALVRSEPRALTGDEVLATVQDFAAGARRALELGFDGVEIMGSEGYLLNQFTAPLTNRRDDEWGGDTEGRLRFPLAVAAAVRDAVGSTGAVVYRMSGADLVEGATPLADVLELAARLQDVGVDAINVGIGWHEARVPTVQLLVPHAAWIPWVRAVGDAVDVPVIASNRINTLRSAEAVLASGAADFVSLARPFLADPEIVAKARAGRTVNVCIACNQACIDRSIFDRRVSCVVNPAAGFEALPTGPSAAGRVAVVGGGPAGMEAARALAAAGWTVTLFEAGERLGGQFRMACHIPGKRDYAATIAYFESELAAFGVEVSLGAPVGSTSSALAGFDGVVVATGVVPRTVEIPGADLPHVIDYAQLLSEPVEVGETVAVIGAGGIGVDVAHLLGHDESVDALEAFYAAYGLTPPGAVVAPGGPGGLLAPARRVTLMRRGARIGESIGPTTRWAALDALRRGGVEVLTGVSYEAIEPGAVRILDSEGSSRLVDAETVVVCAGQVSERGLAEALGATGIPHIVIGGAAQADELDAERAFREGFEAPRRLGAVIGSRA